MFIPKITTYSTQIIPTMYQDGWRLITIYDDKMFWEKGDYPEEYDLNGKNMIQYKLIKTAGGFKWKKYDTV